MCCLACQAGRRQAMHSLYLGTVAPTCSLADGSTSVLVSSVEYQVRATYYSHSYPARLRLVCHALRRCARHHVRRAACSAAP